MQQTSSLPGFWFTWVQKVLQLLFYAEREVSLVTPKQSSIGLDLLHQLLSKARQAGQVHPRAAEIASRALTFGLLTVADVMVPRKQVKALSKTAKTEQIRRVLLEEGYRAFPVYEGNLDHIVGILAAKDMLALAWEANLVLLSDVLTPPYFVPHSMRAADLLHEMQVCHKHFAVVIDELGGTIGIVTLEDLLEKLVGDIYPPQNAFADLPIQPQNDGSVVVHAAISLRDLNRELKFNFLESEAYNTLAGMCLHLADGIPSAGVQLHGPKGVVLEILKATHRQVQWVRIYKTKSIV